ncbi:MAG: ribonuclease J [Culicoidibacterales bacterium]
MATIKIVALGGQAENGKNLYVIEVDEQIFVIDAGLKYPEETMLGIDKIVANFDYLIENKKRVKGVFLTHAHEDHIGALPSLLAQHPFPIYGTKLTLAIAEDLLRQEKVRYTGRKQTINSQTELKFSKDVTVRFFKTTHSIPDSVGIAINTHDGAIVFTSDFVFDQSAGIRYATDLATLGAIGQQGVLALMQVSRGVETPGYAANEQTFRKELTDIFDSCEQRIIISAYATDIRRVQEIIDTAVEFGRKIFIAGVRAQRMIDISLKLGYLDMPNGTLVGAKDLNKYREKLTVIVAGNSGLPFNLLYRMSTHADKMIQIDEEDLVVLATPPVPGTEIVAAQAGDAIFKTGAKVVSIDKKSLASTIAAQEDLKMMINFMKPKYVYPTSGEYRHLVEHADLATQVGIPYERTIIRDNGEFAVFTDSELVETLDRIVAEDVLIDGTVAGDVGSVVLRDREQLSQDGVVLVMVTVSKSKKKVVSGPEIVTRGFIYIKESQDLMDAMYELVNERLDACISEHGIEWSLLKQTIREGLGKYVFKQTKRRPMIIPVIMEVK